MRKSDREEFLREIGDRRRTPRVSCGGTAKIITLPSDGRSLPGRVLNLSLGGCGIETESPMRKGTATEILLRVNGSSLRAGCQVQELRTPNRIGVEFLHLSAMGQEMLRELIRELTLKRLVASALNIGRREPDLKLLKEGRATLIKSNLPIVGRTADPQSAGVDLLDRYSLILNDRELDLFI